MSCAALKFTLLFLLLAVQDGNDSENPDPVEAPPDDAVVATEEQVSVNAVADDDAIQQRLHKIMSASDWFGSPAVDVDEGIVILSGTTDTTRRRDWAGDVARRTEDVVAVVNNITVSESVEFGDAIDTVSRSLNAVWNDFLKHVPLLIASLAVILLTWIAARVATIFVAKTAGRSQLRGGLQDLLLQLTTCGVWVVGMMVAAIVLFPGMTPAKILTVLGLGSVAIGFAFKDIFENFFAGILILWRFPFEKGDFVACNDVNGRVEDITVRMTSIRQVDGQLVVLPNAMLFKQAVYILTSKPSRRITVICGVAYSENIGEARKVIHSAVQACDSVDRSLDIEIYAREFADSSVNFEVTWWTGSTPLDERRSRDEVVESVKRALDDADIEIPFPYRTLTFKEPLPVASGSSD